MLHRRIYHHSTSTLLLLLLHCLFAMTTYVEAISLSSTGNINFRNFAENVISSVFARQKRQSMCDSFSKDEVHCRISVKKLGYDHSLLVDPNDHTSFMYPSENGTIILEQHQTVFLSCPGQNNSFKVIPRPLPAHLNVSCLCGTYFYARKTIYDFYQLSCVQPPRYEIVDEGFYGRESEFRKFEIGFKVDATSFLKLIEVRYNRASTSPIYAVSRISRFIGARQRLAKEQRYDQTHCCERQRSRLDMDAVYSAKTQDRSFARQLYCHDSEFRTRCSYLSPSSATIFKPAQLTPKSSFVYTSSGTATFAYLNTNPQWRPISDGNWIRIEEHVIEMARQLRKDLVVYTGVYDRLRLRDTGDGERDKMMFLYAGGAAEKSIAIPLYFWKLVYEPDSRRAVVFVTLNNLYPDEDYRLCEKPMFSRDGARMPRRWKPMSYDKGYSYMCEAKDFFRSCDVTIDDFAPGMVTDLLFLSRREEALTNDARLVGRTRIALR